MSGIDHYAEVLQNKRILVVGDIMLDEYASGSAARISPEAPVPVVTVSEYKYNLGGAANVAANVRSLGAKAILAGIVGSDISAGILFDMLDKSGVRFAGTVSDTRPTTIKTRVMGNGHQLVRYDRECTDNISAEEENTLLARLNQELGNTNAVIISDYGKGVCTTRLCKTLIDAANALSIPIVVDPKNSDWARYGGAYLIKPNLKEFREAANEYADDITSCARRLIKEYSLKNVLVTRSQDGMTLISVDGRQDFSAEAKEVFDVSGAGDTVAAAIAVFLSAGSELCEAIRLANAAAGIAVGKRGTCTVVLDEIMPQSRDKKLISPQEVSAYIKTQKSQKKKIVFTNGCFDILHTGHISLLEQAKKLGDILIVGLNSDDSVRRLKGHSRPINNEYDRATVLSALEIVDVVVIFDEDTPYELIKQIMPDVLVKGADYMRENVVGANIAGEVVIVPLVEGKSTSSAIKAIKGEDGL